MPAPKKKSASGSSDGDSRSRERRSRKDQSSGSDRGGQTSDGNAGDRSQGSDGKSSERKSSEREDVCEVRGKEGRGEEGRREAVVKHGEGQGTERRPRSTRTGRPCEMAVKKRSPRRTKRSAVLRATTRRMTRLRGPRRTRSCGKFGRRRSASCSLTRRGFRPRGGAGWRKKSSAPYAGSGSPGRPWACGAAAAAVTAVTVMAARAKSARQLGEIKTPRLRAPAARHGRAAPLRGQAQAGHGLCLT